MAERLGPRVWHLGLSSLLVLLGCGEAGAGAGVFDDREALVAGAAYPTRNLAFVLVDVGMGVNITSQAAAGVLTTNPNSLKNLLLYESYGRQDITAQVVGPVSYPLSTCSDTETRNMATALRPQFPGFDHYLYYLGSRLTACTWSSLASVGTPGRPARDSWYNANSTCLALGVGFQGNLGEAHSSSLRCPSGLPFADDPNQCTAGEYGDPFDSMGGGCRHMSAWHKVHQGWLSGCNGVRVNASGTFTLLPFERRCDGPQFLKIKAPKSRTFLRPASGGGPATTETFDSYYLELRTPLDFDGTLGGSALTPRVLVHVGGELRSRTDSGVHTFLLDLAPSTTTFNDAALAQGQTFTDPAGGLSITAQAVSSTQATIVVQSTGSDAPQCLDNSSFTPPGPGPETCVDNPPAPVP